MTRPTWRRGLGGDALRRRAAVVGILVLVTGTARAAVLAEEDPRGSAPAADVGLDAILEALTDADASARIRAAAALESIVAGDRLDEVLDRYESMPLEARVRVRETILLLPATGPSLVRRGREGDAVARELLVLLLQHEIARRVERAHLRRAPLERGAYDPGVVVGLAWPFGAPVPLDAAVRALSRVVHSEKPVCLSPEIRTAAGEVLPRAPVAPLELAPTTASALLERLLLRRGLAVVDAGLVFLIVPEEVERDRKERVEPATGGDPWTDPESVAMPNGPDAAPERRPLRPDAWAARHLADLLLGDGSKGSRQTLLLALRLAEDGEGLPPLDPRGPARPLAAWTGAEAPPEVRAEVLLRLVDRGASVSPLVADLLEDEDPRRRLAGAWLAAAGRIDSAFPLLGRGVRDPERDVAVAAALARVRLRPHDPELSEEFPAALAAGVPAALVRDALEIAYRFARSGERGGAVDPTLLLSSRDEGARAVGAVLLGADAAAGAREVRRLAGAPPSVSLAFAVALARRTGTTPAAPPLLARREEAAAVASLLARSARSELLGRGFVEAAEYAGARGDSMLLRMLTTVAAADMVADEEYRPGRLRTALRTFREVEETSAVVDELWRALTEQERGNDVRVLGFEALPWDRVPPEVAPAGDR